MKTKNFAITATLIAIVVIVFGIEYSQAAKKKEIYPPKIGIVSIREVFDGCNMKNDIEKSLADEGETRFKELKKIEAELENDKVSLSKRKQGSQDYMEILEQITMKQSKLQAKQEFYQKTLALKEMQGKEKIYRKVLEAIEEVAKNNGFDMIISRDDNYLNMPDILPPAQNPSELVLTTKSHKLYYYNKELDVTTEVITAINK